MTPSVRWAGTARIYMSYSMTRGAGPTAGLLLWYNNRDANVCKKAHWQGPPPPRLQAPTSVFTRTGVAVRVPVPLRLRAEGGAIVAPNGSELVPTTNP
jgi:hypothetical protein